MPHNPIKVLFVARPNLFQDRGGDTIQMEKTAEYLSRLGVSVSFYNGGSLKGYEFDLLHLFNVINPEYILKALYESNAPKVLSPIYVKYDEYDRYHRNDLIGKLSQVLSANQVEFFKTVAKVILKGRRVSSFRYYLFGHGGSIKKILGRVKYIMPNSLSEQNRLAKDFGILPHSTVVTNAIDQHVFNLPTFSHERENNVLCVGRIEGRKNQLNLIKAAKIGRFKLKLVGNFAENQHRYKQMCLDLANDYVEFIPFTSQKELSDLYASSKVHVLPSWFETTGLSSLEAAAMGCNVVVTDKGDVREYFGDLAYYCDPASPESIADVINQALSAPVNPELRKLVLENYTWEKAAQQTLSVYKKVLSND